MGITGSPVSVAEAYAGLPGVHSAIRTICYNALTTLDVPMKFDNDPTRLPTSGLRCRVHIDTQDNSHIALGVEQYRFQGDLILNLFADVEKGDLEALQAAGSLVRTFQTASTTTIVFLSPELNVLGIVDANYQINITVPYKSEQYS